jgi:hypothetical protein
MFLISGIKNPAGGARLLIFIIFTDGEIKP